MEKKLKGFRLTDENLRELKEIVDRLGISEAEAVARAIHYFYLNLENEEEAIKNNKLIRFEEYQKLQNQLVQLSYKIGELEGTVKEKQIQLNDKEQQIRDKNIQIENLQNIISKLIEQQRESKENKKWWRFWK